ncbi:hypothetical protein [Rhodococcus sp. X156]|uniref:hypothetical protein n=1 Tax=Rhodococcus sp. X156 TaxID=2499145 RepID=UPI000FD87FB7|nr:hypothetical protein [Rhodococcus sp. X156]
MFRWSVLLLALVMSVPALWSAFVVESMSPTTAGVRFLVAVPVAALMVAALRAVTAPPQPAPAGAAGRGPVAR